MSKELFERLFDLETFKGHELKWECDYYDGDAWHTCSKFYLDGIELKMKRYYSQAYIPFDKRDDEIETCTISNNQGVVFGRKITHRFKINRLELLSLLDSELTIGGVKKGDILYDKNRKLKCKVISMLVEPHRVRVEYLTSNSFLPMIRNFYEKDIINNFEKVED